jgi:hypothetical protein
MDDYVRKEIVRREAWAGGVEAAVEQTRPQGWSVASRAAP